MNIMIKAAIVALLAGAAPAIAQDVKIESFDTNVNITDSNIINTATGVRSTAIVELGSINAKGGDINVNSFKSKVTVKDSTIVNAALGVQARSRVSVGSASTD